MVNKILNYCKEHKWQSIAVVTALVMAFGFHATHYSYHMDMLVDEYYNGTVLISAGRFSAPLLNYFTNWMQFAPFWHTMMLGIILFFAGLIFGLLFKEVSSNKISDNSVFAFWIVFSTFPIIAYQLTFPILSVVFPYILVGIALWLIAPMLDGNKVGLSKIITAVLLLAVSIDMYESYATVFLTMYFALALTKYYFDESAKEMKFRHLIITSLKFAVILAVAIAVDLVLSKLICYAFCGTFEFWYKGNSTVAWMEDSVITVIRWIIRELIGKYVIAGVSNYSIFIFDVACVVGTVVALIISIKRRSVYCVLLYVGTVLSSISLTFVVGSVPKYRMVQAIPLLVAFFVLFIANILPPKKVIRNTAICILCVMVLNQTLYINRYSVLNYERHQYESNILQNIAKDLEGYATDEKEVLFISGEESLHLSFDYTPLFFENPLTEAYKKVMYTVFDTVVPGIVYRRLDARYGREGRDLLCAKNVDTFFNEYDGVFPYKSFNTSDSSSLFVPEIYRAFGKLGYNYIIAEDATAEGEEVYYKIREEYKDMPAYPSDGYITETENTIIVKIYE